MQQAAQTTDMTNRLRLVTTLNPWLADHPGGMALARMNISPDELTDNATALGAAVMGDSFHNQLAGMTPGAQRAVWGGLTIEQQQVLQQQGYQAPQRPEESWIDSLIGGGSKLLGGALNVAQKVPGISPALKALTWVGDQPAHLYRAIRLGSDESQMNALGGAIIGGIAGAAAIPTGGGSLAAAGLIGGGALLGGTLAAVGTNPSDWARAFNASWHGERTFDLPSQRRASEILGDTRLVSLAHDFAGAGITLRSVAEDFAEKGGTGNIAEVQAIASTLATRVAAKGTPEFAKAVDDLITLSSDRAFQDAVNTLVRGKISIGRDTADVMGLTPGTTLYTALSGGVDAAFTVAIDPTLMLGGAAKWNKARRQGMALTEGSEAAARFLRIQENVPGVKRMHTLMASAVADGDWNLARTLTPTWKELYMPMRQHVRTLVDSRTIDSAADFGLDHFNQYITSQTHLVPLLQGIGTVRAEKGIILAGVRPGGLTARRIGMVMRDFTRGLSDPAMEKRLLEEFDKVPPAERQAAGLAQQVPADLFGLIDSKTGFIGAPWMRDASWSYRAGHFVGRVPGASFVGNSLTAITTMAPARSAVSLDNADEIHAFSETLRVAGMPSWARRQWVDTIMDMPNWQARRQALIGALDNAMTVSGARATERGKALVDRYILHEQQAYGLGGYGSLMLPNGTRMINGILPGQTAVEMVMPDLAELRKATAQGWMADYLQYADRQIAAPILKVWRPAVILRIGFIPRAAGEELASYMTRGGLGGMVQEWSARAIGRHEAWKIAYDRATAGLPTNKVQQALLREGPVEGHIATLARAMDRTRWDDPKHMFIDNYFGWLRRSVDAEAPFEKLAGVGPGMLSSGTGATLLSSPTLGTARRNVASNLSNLMLGNPLSWRRMIIGGVNDDLIESATQLYSRHGRSLLEATTSLNAGPLDRGYDRELQERVSVKNAKGEYEDVVFNNLPGEHETLLAGDPRWQIGMHTSVNEVMHDNVLRDVWAEYMPRIAGGYVGGVYEGGIRVGGVKGDVALKQLKFAKARYAAAESREAKMIVDEFLGAPREDSFRSMLVALDRVNPELAAHMKANVAGIGVPKYADVSDAVRDFARARPADEAAQAVAKQVRETKDLVDMLDTQKLDVRRFYGAHLKSRISADAPLYKSWDDAAPDMQRAIEAKLKDARSQEQTMRGAADPALAQGQVLVYAPPRIIPRVSDGAEPTFDDLVNMATHRDVLYKNRETVERILEHDLGAPGEWQSLVASRELADELTEASQRWAGYEPDPADLKVIHFDNRILRASGVPTQDLMAPLAGKGDNLAAWSVNRDAISERLAPVGSIRSLDDEIRTQAENMMGRARQVFTRDVVPVFTPRVGRKADGSIVPKVYRVEGRGRVTPLTDAETVTDGKYVTIDAKGVQRPIDVTDAGYFTPTDVEHGAGTVPWEMIGPMLEDVADDLSGAARWVPKQEVIKQGKDVMIPSGDMIRVWRSRLEHVQESGAGLANAVVVPRRTLAPVKKGLDRMVETAFDKGIGPAVDALARRPMALHFFHERYQFAKRAQQWSLPDGAVKAVDDVIQMSVHAAYAADDMADLARHTRAVAKFDGEKTAGSWSDAHSLAWLRSHDEADLAALLRRTEARSVKRGAKGADAKAGAAYMADRDHAYLANALHPNLSTEDFLAYAKSKLPIGGLESWDRIGHAEVQAAIKANPVLRTVTDDQWKAIIKAEAAHTVIRESATDFAAHAAINDMVPFIDSHRFKTQFADKAKSLMPFWYAEENFMKRWARTILLDPTAVRKAQLGYHGLRATGVVRTDAYGKDAIVIPGSAALTSALWGLPGIGVMFQMQTDRMLPGINSRFGVPSFSPIVTAPLDMAVALNPALQPLENAVAGDYAQVPWYSQIVPAAMRNLYQGVVGNPDSQQYMSMWTNVVAQSIANGSAPEDGASALDREKWLSDINQQVHIALLAGGLLGIITPASPKAVVAGETASFTGIGAQNPKELLSSTYYDLIGDLGIEQGTIEFNRLYPSAGLEGIVNPEAFLVGKTVSKSGAVVPATAQAATFIRENGDYFSEFPEASAWLLPVDDSAAGDTQSLNAYDAATVASMRRDRTKDEFLAAIMFKQGATDYFASQDAYQVELEKANANKDRDRKRYLDDVWQNWSMLYKLAHPVFAEELQNGDAKIRRGKTIVQMRTIVQDPEAPKPPHFEALKSVMESWDLYQANLAYARDDRTAKGRDRVDFLKGRWEDYMTQMVRKYPPLSSFWTSVLRPESSLT